MMIIKVKLMNQMNQVKMKSNLILVMWSGLNMVGFGILLKYVVWMMYPVICNIGFVYKITKLLLNFSSVNSSQIDVLGENLVDVARAAKSTFIMGQYNTALGKRLWYTEIPCDENIH